ncbi:DgyrCDS10340 [Dimorphilus gyrociliatus]|uniref:DgyrCDS10340 n=1 Tax=Dimorphilus gyrociliatus TaxID=2664684 RepID=A0A7I8W126_9ANNE|nr:DgyrCDS10340 [Dimorphilus gyrociliatus]
MEDQPDSLNFSNIKPSPSKTQHKPFSGLLREVYKSYLTDKDELSKTVLALRKQLEESKNRIAGLEKERDSILAKGKKYSEKCDKLHNDTEKFKNEIEILREQLKGGCPKCQILEDQVKEIKKTKEVYEKLLVSQKKLESIPSAMVENTMPDSYGTVCVNDTPDPQATPTRKFVAPTPLRRSPRRRLQRIAEETPTPSGSRSAKRGAISEDEIIPMSPEQVLSKPKRKRINSTLSDRVTEEKKKEKKNEAEKLDNISIIENTEDHYSEVIITSSKGKNEQRVNQLKVIETSVDHIVPTSNEKNQKSTSTTQDSISVTTNSTIEDEPKRMGTEEIFLASDTEDNDMDKVNGIREKFEATYHEEKGDSQDIDIINESKHTINDDSVFQKGNLDSSFPINKIRGINKKMYHSRRGTKKQATSLSNISQSSKYNTRTRSQKSSPEKSAGNTKRKRNVSRSNISQISRAKENNSSISSSISSTRKSTRRTKVHNEDEELQEALRLSKMEYENSCSNNTIDSEETIVESFLGSTIPSSNMTTDSSLLPLEREVIEKLKPKKPEFAQVEVARKKKDRKNMDASPCFQCEAYFADLDPLERAEKLKLCRHKANFRKPSTPETYWNVGFPNTEHCVEKGYMNTTQTKPSKFRRKKAFKQLFERKEGNEDYTEERDEEEEENVH